LQFTHIEQLAQLLKLLYTDLFIKKCIMKYSAGFKLKYLFVLAIAMVLQPALWAQDSGGSAKSTTVTHTSTTTSTDWYTMPWVWVVGGIILIILLVALLSGGRRSTTVVSDSAPRTVRRTTVVEDDDTV
jgi:hypothetical protein